METCHCYTNIKSLERSAWSIIIPTNINDLRSVQINEKANQQPINLVSWKTPFTQFRGGGQSFSLGGGIAPSCPSLATGLAMTVTTVVRMLIKRKHSNECWLLNWNKLYVSDNWQLICTYYWRSLYSLVQLTAYRHKYEGRSINKLQNSIILLIFRLWKFWTIYLVADLILSTSCVSLKWCHCDVIYKH